MNKIGILHISQKAVRTFSDCKTILQIVPTVADSVRKGNWDETGRRFGRVSVSLKMTLRSTDFMRPGENLPNLTEDIRAIVEPLTQAGPTCRILLITFRSFILLDT